MYELHKILDKHSRWRRDMNRIEHYRKLTEYVFRHDKSIPGDIYKQYILEETGWPYLPVSSKEFVENITGDILYKIYTQNDSN